MALKVKAAEKKIKFDKNPENLWHFAQKKIIASINFPNSQSTVTDRHIGFGHRYSGCGARA